MVGYYPLYIMVYNWFYVQNTVKKKIQSFFTCYNCISPKCGLDRFFVVWTGLLGLAIIGNRLQLPVAQPPTQALVKCFLRKFQIRTSHLLTL